MAQKDKRSLRERKVTQINEDIEPHGYKSSSKSKIPLNPAAQLRAEAKILTKFINQINGSLNDSRKIGGDQLCFNNVRTKVLEKQENCQEKQKAGLMRANINIKAADCLRMMRNIPVAPIRQMPHEEQLQTKMQFYRERADLLNLRPAHLRQLEKVGSIDQLQHLSEAINFLASSKVNASHTSFKNDPNVFYLKEKSHYINKIEQKIGDLKPSLTDNKFFKRSFYHIAIAYHIHIKHVKEKNLSVQQIDPTYFSRKLRDNLK